MSLFLTCEYPKTAIQDLKYGDYFKLEGDDTLYIAAKQEFKHVRTAINMSNFEWGCVETDTQVIPVKFHLNLRWLKPSK